MIDENKIKKMIEDGFAQKKISAILKLNGDEIKELKTLVLSNNWVMLKENFDDNKIPYIKQLYKDGVSAKSLGKKFSIGKEKVQKWAEQEGMLRAVGDANRITFFNQHIFDKIDTKEKAYWLGFLYADCYNCESTSTISLSLAVKDFDHLIKFSKFLSYPEDQVFRGEIGLNDEKYPTANIKLYSKYLCKVLHDLGCPQAKSLILKFPHWMQNDLQRYFVLGYFDGDGSIKMHSKTREWGINICGTKDMLDGIYNLFKQQKINANISYHSETNNDTWVMDTRGNEQVARLCEWLYNDLVVYMNRKYERFLKLKEQQANRRISKTRDNYLLSDETKKLMAEDIKIESDDNIIAKKYNIHRFTVERLRIKMALI